MRLARAVELVPVSVKCPLPEQFPEYACCHGDTCEKLPLLVGGEILERETEEYQRHLVLGEKFCAPFNDTLPLIAGDVLTDQRQDVLFFVLEMGIDSGPTAARWRRSVALPVWSQPTCPMVFELSLLIRPVRR